MANHIYKIIHLVGSSTVGIEDAIEQAVLRAGETVRNMRWFEVVETRGHIADGKVAHWQVTIRVGFTLDGSAGDAEAILKEAIEEEITKTGLPIGETPS